MHNQGANVPFNLTSGEFQKAGTFSPSFPDGAEWSCSSAGNPPEGTTLCSPLPTPRRKLSLDALDDNSQSPLRTESIDSGECLFQSMRTEISLTTNLPVAILAPSSSSFPPFTVCCVLLLYPSEPFLPISLFLLFVCFLTV